MVMPSKSFIPLSLTLLAFLTSGCAELSLTSEQLVARTRTCAKESQVHAVNASRSESIARRALHNAVRNVGQAKEDLANAEAAGTVNSAFRRAATHAERDRVRAKSSAEEVFMYARRSIGAASDVKDVAEKCASAPDRATARAHERTAQKLLGVSRYGARRADRGAQRLKEKWLSFLKEEEPPEKGK